MSGGCPPPWWSSAWEGPGRRGGRLRELPRGSGRWLRQRPGPEVLGRSGAICIFRPARSLSLAAWEESSGAVTS